jgi:oxygen-dependent protoporphyrinogen oxidase
MTVSRKREPSGSSEQEWTASSDRSTTGPPGRDPTVGVVGAGITGLAVHHYLRERGVDSVVFEADDQPGGVVRSETVDGLVLDFGPQRTRRTPSIDALIGELDLRGEVIEAADVPLYVLHDGSLRAAPLSVRRALSTDLLSLRGKLRLLGEVLAGPPREGETVASYLERSFGREAAKRVLGPLYAGLYGSDPDEMYARYTIARALDNHGIPGGRFSESVLATVARRLLAGVDVPPAVTFAGGMQTLPESLYRRHRARVRLRTPVTAVESAGDRYRLAIDGGSVAVDAVVLTTSAAATSDLVDAIDPDSARNLRRLAYNPLAVVHLRAGERLAGAGSQLSLDEAESRYTRGATWNAGLFGAGARRDGDPRRSGGSAPRADRGPHSGAAAHSGPGVTGREGLYTCYLGGAIHPEVVEWSDDRLVAVAVREFREVTGVPAEPISVRRLSPGMPAYDTSWTALEAVDPPAGVHLCANYVSRAGLPGRIRAARRVAETLVSRSSTTPGASATG